MAGWMACSSLAYNQKPDRQTVKGSINRNGGRTKWIGLLTSAVLLNAAVLETQAQLVTLVDQTASTTINLGGGGASQLGMNDWHIAGINNLAQQWFWFRAGSIGPEQPITAIGGLSFSTPNARTLYASYNNGSYGVTINYLLTGTQVVNSNVSSDISESITITNAGTSPLEFHFFQYSDFDLAGTPTGDTVTLGKNLRGLYNEADQSKTGGPIGAALTETVVTPGANRGEAELFNNTLVKLSDGNTDNLNNNNGPVTGDVTWAFQWDFIIPAGSSVGISKDKYITLIGVPEPSLFAFASLGLVGYLLRKRRNS